MKPIRILSALLAAIFLFGVSGCGGQNGEKDSAVLTGEAELIITPVKPEIESESESASEPQPEDETYINNLRALEAMGADFVEIADLGAENVPWGPGVQFDAEGKPVACVGLQERYGKYNADFLRAGDEYKGKVYLTFDEGYENGYTGAILDTLKEKGVSAVFFVTLPYAKSQPELIRRMIDEGHIVGNHSARHKNFTQLTLEEAYAEVADCHSYMQDNFDYSMYLWRFPEGAFSEQSVALLQKMGYRSVFWSFAYKDWDPAAQMDTGAAFAKITGSLHDGEIFLLHAVSATNAAVLGDVVDHVRGQGYEFAKYTLD